MATDDPKPSTVAQALAAGIALGIDRLDAQLLLLHALGRAPHDRAWLLAHDTDAMPDTAWSTLSAQLSRRLAGEPVAYLLGEKEFHGLDLRVDARVLVPRPDTETLVEWALQSSKGKLRRACSTWARAAARSRWPSSTRAPTRGSTRSMPAPTRWRSRRPTPGAWACRCASPWPTGSTAPRAATRS